MLKLKRPPKESRGAGAVWTEAEFWQVYGAANGDFKPLLMVLRETGARPSEVTGLTVESVSWAQACAVLLEHKNAHRGKRRVLHFTAPAMAALTQQRDRYEYGHLFRQENNRPFVTHNLVYRMIHARDRAGVSRPLTLYGLRHTFITRALERGLTGDQVAALVGNSPAMIHKHYGHLTANHAAMAGLMARASGEAN